MEVSQSSKKVEVSSSKQERNYQIDVLKFIFILFVFLSHTTPFINKNTEFVMPHAIGYWAVFFFFIVSGFLMIKSQIKRAESDKINPGKGALDFVLNKFKSLAFPYIVSFFIALIVYIIIYGINLSIVRVIPELLCIHRIGLDSITINGSVWYISAMLIAMLPLYYILTKNRSFYIYVFAPIVALLSYAYIFHLEEPYMSNGAYINFLTIGVIRAVNGLCFGSITWIIYEKLIKSVVKKSQKILITIVEILLYFTIFAVWFSTNNYKEAFSVMLLLPPALAITFSQASYISTLFRFKFLKHIAPISLAIFFNHWAARVVVMNYFPNESYKSCVGIMFGLTIVFSIIYFIIIKLAKLLWDKKLKAIFTETTEV